MLKKAILAVMYLLMIQAVLFTGCASKKFTSLPANQNAALNYS